MLEQVKILTSRRAYEFTPDALRLSSVSIQPVQRQIQQLFNFQSSAIGSPMPMFGEVPTTYPPGIVFNLGAWIYQQESIVPIRFLHFEPNRIVIDIAGPTAAIDGIADRLFHFLSGLQAADGTPIVGEPVSVLDYSEITAQFPYPLDVIFSKPLLRVLGKTMGIAVGNTSMTLVPSVVIQIAPTDVVLSAVPSGNRPSACIFSLPSRTPPDGDLFHCASPLP